MSAGKVSTDSAAMNEQISRTFVFSQELVIDSTMETARNFDREKNVPFFIAQYKMRHFGSCTYI